MGVTFRGHVLPEYHVTRMHSVSKTFEKISYDGQVNPKGKQCTMWDLGDIHKVLEEHKLVD